MSKIMRLYTMIVVALLLLMVPVSARAAGNTNGKIIFTKLANDSSDVWALEPDGSNAQRLGVSGMHSPVWSPDGRKIAVVNAAGQLWVMNAHGDERQLLTDAQGYQDDKPVWSPDGTKIAFVRREATMQDHSAVLIVELASKREIIVGGWNRSINYRSPSWSPDGKQLVFQRIDLQSSMLVIKNLQSGSLQKLTDLSDTHNAEVKWSPNGKKILFNDSYGQVYTIWPDGSHRAVISDGDSYHAAWSPDGSSIAFIEDFADSTISISSTDGSINWLPVQKSNYTSLSYPMWSPDGKHLVFTMTRQTGDTQLTDLFTIEIATKTQIKIATAVSGIPHWQLRRN